MGAETGIQKSQKELMSVNCWGTEQVLRFAKTVDLDGTLERFVFVSTAYVAGVRNGTIMETDSLPGRYSSYYEMSKARAVCCRSRLSIRDIGMMRHGSFLIYLQKWDSLRSLLQNSLSSLSVQTAGTVQSAVRRGSSGIRGT
ncbi:MAG: SDR family oxidoreductase [Lachnospiraceae bacterium]|nr:SDR family oxidoreductase [Lachnospiraceae bacterium]